MDTEKIDEKLDEIARSIRDINRAVGALDEKLDLLLVTLTKMMLGEKVQ